MHVRPPLQVIKAHRGGIWAICPAPFGAIITAGGDGLLKSWRVEPHTGRLVPLAETATPHSEVLLVHQSPHGVLISAGHDGGVATWELDPASGRLHQRQQLSLSGDRQHYNDRLLETHSGYLLAWASGTIGHPALCRWSEAEQAFSFLQELPVERADVFLETPEGDLLSGDEAGLIRCWRLEAASGDWREEGLLQAHDGPVHALAWPQNHTLVSAGGHEPLIKSWSTAGDISQWVLAQALPGHQSQIIEVMQAGPTGLLSADRGERSLLGWRRRPELLSWNVAPSGLRLIQRLTGRFRGLVGGGLILEQEGESALSLWDKQGDTYERMAVLAESTESWVHSLVSLEGGTVVAGGLDGRLISWNVAPHDRPS